MNRPLAIALVAAGALCISFAAPLVKAIELGPSAIGAYRTGIAAFILGLISLLHPGSRVRLTPGWQRPVLWSVLAGVAFGLDLFIWHRSIILTGAGLATLLANTQVFWVAIVSAVVLSETLTLRFVLCSLGAVMGIALLTVPGLLGETLSGLGTAYGLGAAVFYALYILCLRASQQHPSALPIVPNLAIASASSAFVLVVGAAATNEAIVIPSPSTMGLLIALALVVQISGWLFISRAMPHLPARISSLIILLQPVLATVWGIIFFDEALTSLDALGGLMTLLAIYAATAWKAPEPVLPSQPTEAQPRAS